MAFAHTPAGGAGMRRAVESALFSLSILGLAIILAGCGGTGATTAPGTGATTAPGGASAHWSPTVDVTAGGNGATASVSLADGWPAAWVDLPAPDWCALKPLDLPNITDTSLTIYCRYGTTDQSLNDQAVQAYLVTLTSRGFHLTDTTASYYELNNGPIDVKVHPNTPGGMEIEAKK
jgi:hypothetical protein